MTKRAKIAAKHSLQKRIEPKSEICQTGKKKVEKNILLQNRYLDEYWENCFMHRLFPKMKNVWKTMGKYKTKGAAQIVLDKHERCWKDKKIYEDRIIEKGDFYNEKLQAKNT
jgi:hypothetical protein